MGDRMPRLLFFSLVLLLMDVQAARCADIRLIAANAVKEGLVEIIVAFESATGHSVAATWTGTSSAEQRLNANDPFDVAIIGGDAVDRLIAAGKLTSASKIAFARTGIAVATREGYPSPNVATPEALRDAVLSAGTIAYSAGPSGAYMADLFKRWGITEITAGKTRKPSSGAEVAQALASGEIDIGFAQASEFRGVAKVKEVGPLPSSIQNFTVYTAAASAPGEAAEAFLHALQKPESARAIRKMNMEPN